MFAPIILNANNPGPMTGGGNNTYLVGEVGACVLIDAGIGEAAHLRAIDEALARRRTPLASVVVTHGHRDHASGAAALATRHPAASFEKFPWPEEDARYGVDWRALAEGDRVRIGDDSLLVLHTPGHSPDHVVLWHQPSGSMFTGDLAVLGSSIVIDTSRGGNLVQYLASLERLLALEPTRLFPAHGPVVHEPAALLQAYLDHRRFREDQVLAALGAGRCTVETIAESIYDGLGPELMAAARENVRAHLEKLRTEGRAREHHHAWTLQEC